MEGYQVRLESLTQEDADALLEAPILTVVPLSDGFGISVNVQRRDDPLLGIIERQFFVFESPVYARAFATFAVKEL